MGVVVLAALAGVAALAWGWHRGAARRREIAAFATEHGFRYAESDPFGMIDRPFTLFRRGDGRGIDNVVWGDIEGTEVRLFDYWYYERRQDHQGLSHKDYFRFSCALLRIDAHTPHLRIARERLLSRIADAVGLRDIEMESEEFNRRFEIKSRDRKLAYAFLDARMMQWLLDAPGGLEFEVFHNEVLVSCRRLPASELDALGFAAAHFKAQIPAVVSSLYPPNRPRSADSG